MSDVWKPMNGRVTLITGASSGIGRATALRFAKEGSNIALFDINEDGGLRTSSLLEKYSIKYKFYHCDVGNLNSIDKNFSNLIKDFGRVDHAFNNAGIEGHIQDIKTDTAENWSKVLNVNLTSIWSFLKLELIQMSKQNSGTIVNCASIAGKIGFKNSAAYVASKHGIIGLTKVAALETAHMPIRVNAVCPGIIETPMISRLISTGEFDLNQLRQNIPMNRLGTPEEVADAVFWLSSDSSSYVTGHSLNVDGGFLCQ